MSPYELQTPHVYFRGLAPSPYIVVAPMFVQPAHIVLDIEPGH